MRRYWEFSLGKEKENFIILKLIFFNFFVVKRVFGLVKDYKCIRIFF